MFINCIRPDAAASSPSSFLSILKTWQAKFQTLFTLPSNITAKGPTTSFILKPSAECVTLKGTSPPPLCTKKKLIDAAANECQAKLSIETNFESLLEFSQEENESTSAFPRGDKVKTSVIIPNYRIQDTIIFEVNAPSCTFQRLSASSFKQDGVKYTRLPDDSALSYLSGWEVHVQELGVGIVQSAEIVSDSGRCGAPLSRDDDVLSMFLTVTFQCNMTRRVRLQLVDHSATPESYSSYSYNNAPRPKMNVTFLQKLYY